MKKSIYRRKRFWLVIITMVTAGSGALIGEDLSAIVPIIMDMFK